MCKIYIKGNLTAETMEEAETAIRTAVKKAKKKTKITFQKEEDGCDLIYHVRKLEDGKRHAIKVLPAQF